MMVKAAALAEAAAVVVVVVFRAVIITSLGRGGGGSGIGSGCKDKIKGQGLWAGSFQPAGCHYLLGPIWYLVAAAHFKELCLFIKTSPS